MLSNLSDQIRDCYDQAEEARQRADATTDPTLKAILLEMERRWLILVRSYGFAESLGDFTKESKRRQQSIDGAAVSSRLLPDEMLRLHEVSTLLIQERELDSLYRRILDAAVDLMASDMASMQEFDSDRKELRLLAWKGFHPQSAVFWEWVRLDSGSSCAAALSEGRRIIVPDIETSKFIEGDDGDEYRRSGIRSVQSTPLISRSGQLLGMISTHWREVHCPSERALRALDVLARQAADLVERSKSEMRLRESEQRYRAFVTASSDVVYCMSPDWSKMHYLQGKDFIADTESPSHSWLEKYIHPDDQTRVMAAIHKAISNKSIFELEHPIIRVDGTLGWAHSRAVPLLGEKGEIVEWFGAVRDITDRHEWGERQKVLVAELQHRTRNLIGVVRWIAEKTARASADLVDFRDGFRERLDALARVQDLLSRLNEQDRITFDDLIRAEISVIHDGADRVTLLGPPGVRLRSSTVQTLAMALHELTTNAVKYGALAQPSGLLAVTWRFELSSEDGKPWLHIDWRERGVRMPQAGATARSGQGRELIEQALPYQLRAKTSYAFECDGVHCTISVPVSAASEKVSVHG